MCFEATGGNAPGLAQCEPPPLPEAQEHRGSKGGDHKSDGGGGAEACLAASARAPSVWRMLLAHSVDLLFIVALKPVQLFGDVGEAVAQAVWVGWLLWAGQTVGYSCAGLERRHRPADAAPGSEPLPLAPAGVWRQVMQRLVVWPVVTLLTLGLNVPWQWCDPNWQSLDDKLLGIVHAEAAVEVEVVEP